MCGLKHLIVSKLKTYVQLEFDIFKGYDSVDGNLNLCGPCVINKIIANKFTERNNQTCELRSEHSVHCSLLTYAPTGLILYEEQHRVIFKMQVFYSVFKPYKESNVKKIVKYVVVAATIWGGGKRTCYLM